MNVNGRLHVLAVSLLTEPISALTWVADSPSPHEVLINGLKRGVPPKHRYKPIFWQAAHELLPPTNDLTRYLKA